MAKIVNPIVAKVEMIGKLKEGTYGQYRSVLFLDQSQPVGSEAAKIWKSLSNEEAQGLTKGAMVHLVPAGRDRSGKDKHNIVTLDSDSSAADAISPKSPINRPGSIGATWSDEQKLALSAQICDHADLLRFCLEVAHEKFSGLADPRDFRALATTLYLQILRQPQLEKEMDS